MSLWLLLFFFQMVQPNVFTLAYLLIISLFTRPHVFPISFHFPIFKRYLKVVRVFISDPSWVSWSFLVGFHPCWCRPLKSFQGTGTKSTTISNLLWNYEIKNIGGSLGWEKTHVSLIIWLNGWAKAFQERLLATGYDIWQGCSTSGHSREGQPGEPKFLSAYCTSTPPTLQTSSWVHHKVNN